MPLSELSDLVAKLDGIDLRLPEGRSVIAQRIGQLRAMLDRIGASESAAQLSVAARLVQRTGEAATPADEDAKRMVRTLLVAVEQSFHIQPAAPAAAPKAAAHGVPQRRPKESRQAMKNRAAELAVVKDMLLGEVLIHFGVLAPEEISAALELQRDTGQGLGDILVEYSFTTRDEVRRALDYQNTIRSMISGQPKARASSDKAGQPHPLLPTSDRSLGRLRLATEMLLGEMLVLQGTITREGLKEAIELQRTTGMLIGEALIQTGAATRKAIERALVSQGRGNRIGKNGRSRRDS